MNADVIIYFKNLIDSSLTQNPTLINLEFKFKSTDTITAICQRNDFVLFEAFFPPRVFKHFIEKYIEETDELNEEDDDDDTKILRYTDNNDFYLNINYSECFEIALMNKNEKIAIHLLLLLKYTILLSLSDSNSDLNLPKYKNILNFNKNFLQKYLVKIFQFEWHELVEFVLDCSVDENYIQLLEEDLSLKISNKKNKISPFDGLKNIKVKRK